MKLKLTLIALLAGTCLGQNQPAPVGGQVNQRLGPIQYNPDMRLNQVLPPAQLYITGNISQGASFQGLIPYRSPYEINAVLGSDTLYNFRRDSIGAGDLSSRYPAAPSPYFDPARMLTGVAGNQVIRGPVITPYSPYGTMALRPEQIPGSFRSETITQPREYAPIASYNLGPGYPAALNRGGLLGGLPPEMASPGFAPKLTPQEILRNQQRLPAPEQAPGAAAPRGAQPPQPATPMEAAPTPYEQYQQERPVAPPAEQPEMAQRKVTAPEPVGSSSAQYQERIYRGYMNLGLSYLQGRQYYRAADNFRMAELYAPRSAVVVVSQALALFGAGDFMSAAFYLERGLTLAPDFALVALTLPSYFPDEKQLREQLVKLAQAAEQSGQPMQLFLKGYIQLQLKDFAGAGETLRAAQKALPDSAVIKNLESAVETLGVNVAPAPNQ